MHFTYVVESEDRAREIAKTQRGHLTAKQATACGMTSRQIRYRRDAGGWVQVLPDTYRLPGVPESFDGFLRAVQLWMGDDGCFMGTTAAFIYGLDGVEIPARVHISRRSGIRHPSMRITRIGRADATRTRWVDGLRTCQMERALLDVAADVPPKVAGHALDDALRRRLTTLARLNRFLDLEGGRGRRGSKVLRELLTGRDHRDGRVRSVFETKMLRILRRIKGTAFEADHLVVIEDQRFFLDFFIPAAMLGIECHSFRWHVGGHNHDTRRDRKITSGGIEILYFTWDDVVFDACGVEREIVDAIGRRLGRLFRPSDALDHRC